MSESVSGPAAASQTISPYPPCIFKNPEEKTLYRKLKHIYERHSSTWDQASRDAWPWLVERASLKPTTIKKVTSHMIAKTLTEANITWAHVVVLRVIFKETLFGSQKIIKIIRQKYPSASFGTFSYNEEYKMANTATVVAGPDVNHAMASIEMVDDDDDNDDDNDDDEGASVVKQEKPVAGHEARGTSPTAMFLNAPEHHLGEKKRKQPVDKTDDDAKRDRVGQGTAKAVRKRKTAEKEPEEVRGMAAIPPVSAKRAKTTKVSRTMTVPAGDGIDAAPLRETIRALVTCSAGLRSLVQSLTGLVDSLEDEVQSLVRRVESAGHPIPIGLMQSRRTTPDSYARCRASGQAMDKVRRGNRDASKMHRG